MEEAIKVLNERIDILQKEYDEIYTKRNDNLIELRIEMERLRCLSKAIIELKIARNMIKESHEQQTEN